MPFSIRHIEPIKIRKVKVSNRKTTNPSLLASNTSSTKCGISTASSQPSMKPSEFSFNSVLSSTSRNPVPQYLFASIQEIHETSVNGDDSLILELNNLLSKKPSAKESVVARPKDPIQIDLDLRPKASKEKSQLKPAKKLPRVLSHRAFY